MKRLEQQMQFIEEIDKEKSIYRQSYICDGSRKENDAEHAWHMSIMALLLSEHVAPEIDVLETISMLLIHDLVEIDAGDTYAYDEAAKRDQKEREAKAAKRIFGLLPDDQKEKFMNLFAEFETGNSKEAQFARALDRFQPMILNAASGGKSWKEHDVKLSSIEERNEQTKANAKELWDYAFKEFLEPHVKKGNIIND